MKEYQLDLVVPEPLGVPLISVQVGSIIEVDARWAGLEGLDFKNSDS